MRLSQHDEPFKVLTWGAFFWLGAAQLLDALGCLVYLRRLGLPE